MSDDNRSTRARAGGFDVRAQAAAVIWIIAVVCALLLVLGALLVTLKANPDNSIRNFFVGGAELLDGPLSRDHGLFTFEGADAATKSVLVNWGIAAITYLIVGSLLRRIIRPST